MTVRVAAADVDDFVLALQGVADAAAALPRDEGAEEVARIAASLAGRARSGTLAPGALPLRRAFGEWDYGAAGEPVWARIDAAERIWDERLGGGDFVVA